MEEIRLIDANALRKAFKNHPLCNDVWLQYSREIIDNAPTIEITEEQAIDKLHETGWLPEHDKQMTERPHEFKTCDKCKYYLYRSNEYPCSRCIRNNVLVDEIREQQNDRWKDGTSNG